MVKKKNKNMPKTEQGICLEACVVQKGTKKVKGGGSCCGRGK